MLLPECSQNDGIYIISPGVEIVPGVVAAEVPYDYSGAFTGVATGNVGVGKDGNPGDAFQLGLELLGGLSDKADPCQLREACIGCFTFSLFIIVAAFEADKMFAATLVMINVLLPLLALRIFGANASFFGMVAAYSELAISLLRFCCVSAAFLNSYFWSRAAAPLGKPFGFLRKGPRRSKAEIYLAKPLTAKATK